MSKKLEVLESLISHFSNVLSESWDASIYCVPKAKLSFVIARLDVEEVTSVRIEFNRSRLWI